MRIHWRGSDEPCRYSMIRKTERMKMRMLMKYLMQHQMSIGSY